MEKKTDLSGIKNVIVKLFPNFVPEGIERNLPLHQQWTMVADKCKEEDIIFVESNTLSNGDIYTGFVKYDLDTNLMVPHGIGNRLDIKTHTRYIGEFRNGALHGQVAEVSIQTGVSEFENRDNAIVCIAEYKDGKKDGVAIYCRAKINGRAIYCLNENHFDICIDGIIGYGIYGGGNLKIRPDTDLGAPPSKFNKTEYYEDNKTYSLSVKKSHMQHSFVYVEMDNDTNNEHLIFKSGLFNQESSQDIQRLVTGIIESFKDNHEIIMNYLLCNGVLSYFDKNTGKHEALFDAEKIKDKLSEDFTKNLQTYLKIKNDDLLLKKEVCFKAKNDASGLSDKSKSAYSNIVYRDTMLVVISYLDLPQKWKMGQTSKDMLRGLVAALNQQGFNNIKEDITALWPHAALWPYCNDQMSSYYREVEKLVNICEQLEKHFNRLKNTNGNQLEGSKGTEEKIKESDVPRILNSSNGANNGDLGGKKEDDKQSVAIVELSTNEEIKQGIIPEVLPKNEEKKQSNNNSPKNSAKNSPKNSYQM